jgi:hypothetical protein
MKTMRSYGGVFILKLVALLVFCAIGLVREGEGKQTDPRFIGTWSLATSEFRTTTGTVTYPLGEKAVGLLIYDSGGRMAAQLMRLDRPKFASGDMRKGTPEEIKAAVDGYVAYFGRFEVNSENRTIVHHVEGSLFPNWLGQDQVRSFEFSSDAQVLTLKTPPFLSGGLEVTGVLIWKRLA